MKDIDNRSAYIFSEKFDDDLRLDQLRMTVVLIIAYVCAGIKRFILVYRNIDSISSIDIWDSKMDSEILRAEFSQSHLLRER